MATKLLIADDDAVNLEVIREHFAESGYELFLCRDGITAWQALTAADSRFDLIIIDREIPALDGISLLKRIKATRRLAALPVILQTDASSPELLRKGLQAGAYCYLTKPYERDALLSIARAALSDAANNAALHKRLREHGDALQLLHSASFEVRTIDEASRLAAYLAQVSPDPDSAVLGLSELLINAIEHGNLGITYAEKSELKRLDCWRGEVQRRNALSENRDKCVRVELWRESDSLRIRIRDDGPGFDWKRYLDFDPARAFDLNGRGIALARISSFDALTYEGCGNSVVATIFNREPAGSPAAPLPPQAANLAFPALRILVVDDNRTNLLLLQPFLNRLGHQTTSAENGQQAVALCLEEKPDIILLDIMMPVMDGFEAARHIRAQTRDRWVPIIFLSALDRNENLLAGLEAGGDDFLSKPINFVHLEAKLRAMQRMLGLQRQVAETSKRIEAISDNIVDALITIDIDATIVACNKSSERIFGWTAKEMLGNNVRMLVPEPYRGEHIASILNELRGDAPLIVGMGREAAAQRKDGTVFPVEIGISEIRFENERLFIGVLRDISARKKADQILRDNAELLQRYHDEAETENQLARSVINTQLLRAELRDQQLHYWLSPAKNFSGDVIAAARSADGRLYALLADATGHGLTAAISTLPVLTIFYSLAPEGAPLAKIVGAINQHLKQSMPVGRFVAATIACIDGSTDTGELWTGGAPEAVLLDAQGKEMQRFASLQLPLGIVDTDEEMVTTTVFSWTTPCQLLICSDGLLEAENRAKTPFGLSSLLSSIRGVPAHQRHDFARSALERHLEGAHAHDDVSLMLIDCVSAAANT